MNKGIVDFLLWRVCELRAELSSNVFNAPNKNRKICFKMGANRDIVKFTNARIEIKKRFTSISCIELFCHHKVVAKAQLTYCSRQVNVKLYRPF